MQSDKVKMGGKYLLLMSYVDSLNKAITFGSEVEIVEPVGYNSGGIYFKLPTGEIGNVADDVWFEEITPKEIAKAEKYRRLTADIDMLIKERKSIYK